MNITHFVPVGTGEHFYTSVSYRLFFPQRSYPHPPTLYMYKYIHTALEPMNSSHCVKTQQCIERGNIGNAMKVAKNMTCSKDSCALSRLISTFIKWASTPSQDSQPSVMWIMLDFSALEVPWAACHLAPTPVWHNCNAPNFNTPPKNLVLTIPLTKALETLSCEFLF